MLCRRVSVCLWYCGYMYVIYAQFTASVGHFEAALQTLFPRDRMSHSVHLRVVGVSCLLWMRSRAQQRKCAISKIWDVP